MSFVSDLTDTFLEEVAIIFLLTILVILLGVPASSLTPFLFYQNDSAEAHISPRCSHTHTHTHTGPLQVEDCVLSSLGFLLLVFSNLMPRMGLKSVKISILAFWHFPRQPAQTLAHSERSVQKSRRKEGRLEFNGICSCPLSW